VGPASVSCPASTARLAAERNDPLWVLSTVGASLHAVQDFYAHSNWVEDLRPNKPGLGGPGIASLGFGSHLRCFDIPPDVRAKLLVGDRAVYTGVKGIPRGHGYWRSHILPRFLCSPDPCVGRVGCGWARAAVSPGFRLFDGWTLMEGDATCVGVGVWAGLFGVQGAVLDGVRIIGEGRPSEPVAAFAVPRPLTRG
jgi:hypothetical protein